MDEIKNRLERFIDQVCQMVLDLLCTLNINHSVELLCYPINILCLRNLVLLGFL